MKTRSLKSCQAVCAATGRKCVLPQDGHEVHRTSARYSFRRLAEPGQEFFPEAHPIDEYAGRHEVTDVL